MENQDKSWKRIVEQSMDVDEDGRDSAVSCQISSMSWELSDDWSERAVDLWKEIQTRQATGRMISSGLLGNENKLLPSLGTTYTTCFKSLVFFLLGIRSSSFSWNDQIINEGFASSFMRCYVFILRKLNVFCVRK